MNVLHEGLNDDKYAPAKLLQKWLMKVNLVGNLGKDSTSINVISKRGQNMNPSVNVLGKELQECSKTH